jgi:succinoglycan biosynthesis transport protein ExoP
MDVGTERTEGAQEEGSIDIQRYFFAVRRHLLKILSAALVVGGLAYLVFSSLPLVYKATSSILIEESNLISDIDELYYAGGRSDPMVARKEILKSKDIAERVVRKLNLVERKELNPFLTPSSEGLSVSALLGRNDESKKETEVSEQDQIAATAKVVADSMTVSSIPRSPVAKISIEGTNAELVAQIANAVADSYIENEIEANLSAGKYASSWLSERLVGLKQKLNDSEDRLQSFMEENGLVEMNLGTDSLASRELNMLSQKLIEARSERLDQEVLFKQLNALPDRSYSSLSSIPEIVENAAVAQLRQSEIEASVKVSELGKRYGYKHPKMVAAKNELSLVKAAALDRMRMVAKSIEFKYSAAVDKEAGVQRSLIDKKSQAQQRNSIEFELSEYRREVDSNLQLYETFLNRIRETSEASDLATVKARVIAPATTPSYPIKPKVSLLTFAAFALTLGVGIALAVLLEILDATIKGPQDVEKKLGYPLLSVIPLVSSGEDSGAVDVGDGQSSLVRAFANESENSFCEAVRTLRTSLTLAGLKAPAKVILFTSTMPSEGKTTMAANLAEAYGQMEKTLLIDADMRRPSLAQYLGMGPNSKGLANAVAYPETLDQCIHSMSGLGMDVMPSGPMPPNPLELLSSKNFEDILSTLKEKYERIIIDTAPTRMVSDALYLSSLADGVVYVVKCDSTPDRVISGSLDKFYGANARVLGVLLNQLDVEKNSKYNGYAYYGGYYDAYGYTANKVS